VHRNILRRFDTDSYPNVAFHFSVAKLLDHIGVARYGFQNQISVMDKGVSMSYKYMLVFVLVCIGFTFNTNIAYACGQCGYSDSLGICWPYDKCVIPKVLNQLNPVTQAQAVLGIGAAVVTGDPKKVTQAVGNALVQSPNFLGCMSVAHAILPNLTDAQINQAIGDGFLTFVATGDPVLVTVDVATNIASQQPVKADDTPTPPAAPSAPPAHRKQKTYTATAQCLIEYKDGTVYGAWRDPATFTDTSGHPHVFPAVDLLKDDIVTLTAPICASWSSPSTGQVSVTSATLKFVRVNPLTGDAKTIKWFIYGPRI
jgi:hypothetical protein